MSVSESVGGGDRPSNEQRSALEKLARTALRSILHFPDSTVGWFPDAFLKAY
jgi:hypothetical protein